MSDQKYQLLTNSRRSSYSDCPRKHCYAYEMCRRPIKASEALAFGTLWHSALEAWWKSDAPLAAAMDVLMTAEANGTDPYDIAKAKALLEAYDIRYSGVRREYNVVAVEAQYDAPLVNPATAGVSQTWRLSGKIDVIVQDGKGRYAIVEHKTTSQDVSPESDYWDRLSIDGQISGYYVGAEVLGYKCDYCIYDVVKKPGLKPLKATAADSIKLKKDGTPYANTRMTDETPEEYYGRVTEDIRSRPDHYLAQREIVRTDDDIADYLYDMWSTGRNIRDAQIAGRWPRNPSACDRYGRCEYFDVCTKCAGIDDDTRFMTVEQNPELT